MTAIFGKELDKGCQVSKEEGHVGFVQVRMHHLVAMEGVYQAWDHCIHCTLDSNGLALGNVISQKSFLLRVRPELGVLNPSISHQLDVVQVLLHQGCSFQFIFNS